MMYQFINEYEVKPYARGFIVLDNKIYSNPTEETLKRAGYKELVEEPQPEYDEATQCLVYKYVDGEVITKKWEVMENTGETNTLK